MCTLKHALWFKEAGFPVAGVTLAGSPLERAFKEHDIPVLALTKRGYFSFKDSRLLRQFLKQHAVDVVFSHHLKDLWRLRLSLIGLSHVRVIGFARMFLRNVNKKDFMHRWVYGRMELLVSLTEVQKEALLKCLPLRPDDVRVIPDGVNVEEFHPHHRNESYRKEVFGVNAGEKAVGLVGRLDPQKGSFEFIQAAHQVLQKNSDLKFGVKFLLIGKETPDTPGFEKKLKDYVSEQGLKEKILFLGHRSDVAQVIANLDVFCMPSYEETFGDVLIEAMACEVPSIATRAGGPINIIDEGVNGLLVPPKDVDALTEALRALLSEPERARTLALSGRQKALNVYDEKKIFAQIKGLLV